MRKQLKAFYAVMVMLSVLCGVWVHQLHCFFKVLFFHLHFPCCNLSSCLPLLHLFVANAQIQQLNTKLQQRQLTRGWNDWVWAVWEIVETFVCCVGCVVGINECNTEVKGSKTTKKLTNWKRKTQFKDDWQHKQTIEQTNTKQ